MAQVNRNVNYLTQVDGKTPWEKLRVIRGFLVDRRQAVALTKLSMEKAEATLGKDSWEWKEHEIMLPETLSNLEDAENEVAFLENIEKYLVEKCEPTRIEGKSDKEMYEINYYQEAIERLTFEAKAEMASAGHISKGLMIQLLQNKPAFENVCSIGLLNPDAIPMLLNKDEILPITFEQDIKLLGK